MAEVNVGSMQVGGLFAGTEVTPMTAIVSIAPQKELKRGTLLGKVKDQDYYDVAAAAGGAEYVLADDVTTGTTAESAVAYKTGVFRASALIVASGDTPGAHEAELRKLNIHMKEEL